MKILLIAPVSQEKRYLKQVADETNEHGKPISSFPVGQGQYFWEKTLKNLGHSVKVFRYTDSVLINNKLRIFVEDFFSNHIPILYSAYKLGEKLLSYYNLDFLFRNKKLLDLALEYRPDLTMISGNYTQIFPETVREIKYKIDTKIVGLNGTTPLIYRFPNEQKACIYYDYMFTNDYYHAVEWNMLGVKHATALPVSACDPEFYRNIELPSEEKEEFGSDVCFVGSLYPERVMLLEQLLDFDLAIYSPRCDSNKLKPHYKGEAYGKRMMKIYKSSKIIINDHGPTMQYGGNMRTFEIPACGAFQLIDRYDKNWFKEGEEIVSYRDIEDLKIKIRYYLKHEKEREKIAKKGQERAFKDHTYEKRMNKMIGIIFGNDLNNMA